MLSSVPPLIWFRWIINSAKDSWNDVVPVMETLNNPKQEGIKWVRGGLARATLVLFSRSFFIPTLNSLSLSYTPSSEGSRTNVATVSHSSCWLTESCGQHPKTFSWIFARGCVAPRLPLWDFVNVPANLYSTNKYLSKQF